MPKCRKISAWWCVPPLSRRGRRNYWAGEHSSPLQLANALF